MSSSLIGGRNANNALIQNGNEYDERNILFDYDT